MCTLSVEWPAINEGYAYTDSIKGRKGGAGLTILEFYNSRHSPSGDSDTWQQRISQGQVQLNRVTETDGTKQLRPADVLTYTRAPWQEPQAPNYLHIIYEDADMVVLDKPAGLQVLPGAAFHQRTVLGLLRMCYKSGEGRQAPVPVHRLGRGTSGLLLCAISPLARTTLSSVMTHATELMSCKDVGGGGDSAQKALSMRGQQLPAGGVRKVYRALVQGILQATEGKVDVPIGLAPCPGLEGGLYVAKPDGGKHAHSEWKVLRVMHPCENHSGQTLVEVVIYTGRPHQIRIHMASIGHPLVGDPLYAPGGVPKMNDEGGQTCNTGTVAKIGDCGYFLRAHKLKIYHPTDAKRLLVFEAPPCPPYSV